MYKNRILKRNKVNKILQNIIYYPLTIITAPMGYGKSTSVKEFLSFNKSLNIWISLNEASKNQGYFWTVLTSKIAEINYNLGTVMNGLGFPVDNMQKSRLFDTIISHLSTSSFKDLVLVFDDYQYAENDLLNELLIYASMRQIPGLHLVIISRYRLKTDIIELAAKNLLFQVDMETLRFTNSEVAQYFSNMSFPISKDKIDQVQCIADGWASAVYLIYRGLKSGIPLENISAVQDLMRYALYEHYDLATKETLCALSLLENFTVEFASYSTEIKNIDEMICNLCLENAFIHHDLKTGTYSIHNVFRAFLINESEKIGINKRNIYKRAGYWFIEKQNLNQSFYYLNLGEDYESILKELEKPEFYIKSADRPMLFYYFNLLPKSSFNSHPIAYLKFIHMVIVSGDKKHGSQLLSEFEDKIPYMDYDEDNLTEIYAAVHLIKVFLTFNNLEVMINHTKEVHALLNGRASIISSYQGPFSFGSPHLTYIYYKEAGTFEKISKMPLELYSQISGGAGLGSETLCAAEYALETGDFNQVEVNALKTICKANTKKQTSMNVCATLTLARLYIFQNRYPQALSLLDNLGLEVSTDIESILMNTYDLCLGYIYSCTGEYEKIPRWIKEGNMTINSLMMQGAVFSYVIYGKALILSENWAKTEALCESFIPYFGIFNNQLGFIHNYIHLSIATYKRGNIEKSKDWLNKALQIGQQDKILMPFCENGNNLLPILSFFIHEGKTDKDYILKLIDLCTKYSTVITGPNFFGNILTPRETEILKLSSKGMSRTEIAENLFISAATVRTHTQNIYEKLGVCKKGDALKKAVELHII